MLVLSNILRSHASRRARRAKTQKAFDRQILSLQQIRTRSYRRILPIILALLVFISFMEVVMTPGKLIRRHLVKSGVVSAAKLGDDVIANDAKEYKLPFGMLTDEQKATQKKEQLERIEKQLRSTHEKLDASCQKLVQAQQSLNSYCRTRLKIVPDPRADPVVPKCLVDVVANEQTAQVAWATLIALPDQADQQLRTARQLLESVAAHFTAGSFLSDDDRDMQALMPQLTQTLSDVMDARSCVDHIATLQRVRAALAHDPPQEDNQRTPP